MTVRKVDWIVLSAAGLVVLLVSFLPSPRDRNPPVPDTPDHRAVRETTVCVHCHGSEGARPLPPRHPKRQDCFRCHRAIE